MVDKNFIQREKYSADEGNGSQKDGQLKGNFVCIKRTHIWLFKATEDD